MQCIVPVILKTSRGDVKITVEDISSFAERAEVDLTCEANFVDNIPVSIKNR